MVTPAPRWATRCTSCGTSFRVTEEQLQVSEGHVRCGRCDAVFNARSSLYDLDSPDSAPAPLTPAAARPVANSEVDETPVTEAAAISQGEQKGSAYPEAPKGPAATPEEPQWDSSDTVVPDSPEPQWEPTSALPSNTDASADPNARLRDLLGVSPADERSVATSDEPSPGIGPSAAPSPAPSQWSSLETPVRRRSSSRASRLATGLLVTAAAALAFALPAQWAWIEREPLRARYPALDAWLNQHLGSLTSVGWKHLEGLTVASSALQATPQGDAYLLELVISNRAPHRLAMPSLDLSLNDAKGQLLLRRTLSPGELEATAQRPLAAGEQRKLQAVFRVQGAVARVSGYELGLFHP